MPRTPFPFPDPPQHKPAFPTTLPMDQPIWRLSSWWLELRCTRCARTTFKPLRLLSAQIGWDVPLKNAAERFRCPDCGDRPSYIALVEDTGGGSGGFGEVRHQKHLVIRQLHTRAPDA